MVTKMPGKTTAFTMTMDEVKFDQAITITPPPADQVTDVSHMLKGRRG